MMRIDFVSCYHLPQTVPFLTAGLHVFFFLREPHTKQKKKTLWIVQQVVLCACCIFTQQAVCQWRSQRGGFGAGAPTLSTTLSCKLTLDSRCLRFTRSVQLCLRCTHRCQSSLEMGVVNVNACQYRAKCGTIPCAYAAVVWFAATADVYVLCTLAVSTGVAACIATQLAQCHKW